MACVPSHHSQWGWRSSADDPSAPAPSTRNESPVLVEQFLWLVTAHPLFKYFQVRRVGGDIRDRDLVRTPVALEVVPAHLPRRGPTFGAAQMIIGQRGRTALPVRRASFWIFRISRHNVPMSPPSPDACCAGHSLPQTKACIRSRRK